MQERRRAYGSFRPPAGRQVEQSPKRLDSPQVPHVLPRISRRVDQLACPMQPDDAVRATAEYGHDRNWLAVRTIASVISTEAIMGG